MAENLKSVKAYPKNQQIVRGFSIPSRRTVTSSSFAATFCSQGGCGEDQWQGGPERLSGKALVFDNEQDALAAILDGRVKKGHVIVIRYEGPVGGPGMREMLSPHLRSDGEGAGQRRGTDHRRPLLRGAVMASSLGTSPPRRRLAGRSVWCVMATRSRIDAVKHKLNLDIPAAEIKARLKRWKRPTLLHTRGVLAKICEL